MLRTVGGWWSRKQWAEAADALMVSLLMYRRYYSDGLSCRRLSAVRRIINQHHILTETLHSLHPRFTAVLMSPFVMSGTVLSISRLPSTERKKTKHATLLLTHPQRLRGVLTAAAHKEHHLYLVNMLFLKIRYIAGGCGDRK